MIKIEKGVPISPRYGRIEGSKIAPYRHALEQMEVGDSIKLPFKTENQIAVLRSRLYQAIKDTDIKITTRSYFIPEKYMRCWRIK